MAFLFADRPALLKDLDNDEARVIEYERVRDRWFAFTVPFSCLLYTSDAADE